METTIIVVGVVFIALLLIMVMIPWFLWRVDGIYLFSYAIVAFCFCFCAYLYASAYAIKKDVVKWYDGLPSIVQVTLADNISNTVNINQYIKSWQSLSENSGLQEAVEVALYLKDYDVRNFVDIQYTKLWLDVINWKLDSVPEDLTLDSVTGDITYTEPGVGIDFDTTELTNRVLDAFLNNNATINATDLVTVAEPEAVLQGSYAELKWLRDWSLIYSNGISLTGSDLYEFVDKQSGALYIPYFYIDQLLDDLDKSYNTKETKYSFRTSSGDLIDVDYSTYGVELRRDEELQFVLNSLRNRESSVDRTPELSGYDGIDKDYIEVSLEDQHIWFYLDGELHSESDIVTGTRNKRDTPKGVFYITERIPGKYLTGADYKTWVNRWMRLTNSGVGLHDATWRGNFGGNIYVSNGSHGCINLPKKFAYDLYDSTYVGLPVIIY